MLFQTLDSREECIGIYKDGSLAEAQITDDLTHTWITSQYLCDREIECAYLYCKKTLFEACPEDFKQELGRVTAIIKAFLLSVVEARIDPNQHCLFDLVPDQYLVELCEVKNKISQHVFDNYRRPKDYTFLRELHWVAQAISHKKLNLDFTALARNTIKFANRSKLKSVRAADPYVRYDIFGSKTGRLTTQSNSFPILNINKSFRQALKPNNDKFVEFDFNAFELRILLYLLDKEQPPVDIHQWNIKSVYKGRLTREEAKKRIFSWLYNLDSKDYLTERIYDRDKIIEKYWDGVSVTNPFGRVIEADRFHAISYLVQSTAADIVLRQMIKVHKLLGGNKSYISFAIHDSVVIDMAEEDMSLLPELKRQFSTFRDTQFLTNVSIGSDFGNMESKE